jgi:hypothetical protein
LKAGIACIAALATALGLGACGIKKEIDTARAETAIKRGLQQQTGAPLRSVRCPGKVEAKKGDVFRCTATAVDGSHFPVRVTQTDGDGGVKWRIAR